MCEALANLPRLYTIYGIPLTMSDDKKPQVCPRGHEVEGDNVVASILRQKGYKICRTCHNKAALNYYHSNKASILAKAKENYAKNRVEILAYQKASRIAKKAREVEDAAESNSATN